MAAVIIDIKQRQNTTPLGDAIVQIADRWAAQNCKETTANRGVCIDKVHELYNNRVIAEAYCAKYAFVVVQEGCEQLNIKNILPKSASAKGILDASMKIPGFVIKGKQGIALGAVFVRRSKGTGSGWHVGLVRHWNNDKFFTNEGNNGDRIGWFSYEWEEIIERDFYFIQTHKMSEGFQYAQKTVTETAKKIETTISDNKLPALLLLGAAGLVLYKIA